MMPLICLLTFSLALPVILAKPLAQDLFDPLESFALEPPGDQSYNIAMAGEANDDLDQTQDYSDSFIPGSMSG
jgi:hypothetical protein